MLFCELAKIDPSLPCPGTSEMLKIKTNQLRKTRNNNTNYLMHPNRIFSLLIAPKDHVERQINSDALSLPNKN
jgi:hypothetical protein